ncbi:hypothetical protein PoB_005268500 [Plakobranchus ocellatus]|uniref:Uncharacterized protein n=1 Tax=Plakobranchus ocellatus TaxID=259542 RepID=A0AAV4C3I2_9GAST|nr:hypothetical protein PoB_005268500 [Plakobranchus ocellatus]
MVSLQISLQHQADYSILCQLGRFPSRYHCSIRQIVTCYVSQKVSSRYNFTIRQSVKFDSQGGFPPVSYCSIRQSIIYVGQEGFPPDFTALPGRVKCLSVWGLSSQISLQHQVEDKCMFTKAFRFCAHIPSTIR